MTGICLACETEYSASPFKFRNGRKFCSRKCQYYYLGKNPERFWKLVKKTETCWLWTGCHSRNKKEGYGMFGGTRAHRYSYEIAFGPIPEGMSVLHKCDNPSCVNPDHLKVGDAKENAEDAVSKGRNTRGSMRRNSVLSEEHVGLILTLRGAGLTHSKIGSIFGVTATQICRVVKRKSWKHL